MQFEQLRCLIEVADTGSITAAAKRMYISQQAVSVKIKQLEEELQCSLLVREKDGVSLTQKGKAAVAFAQKILAEKEQFCSQICQTEELENLSVNVCSVSSVINIVLPNVVDLMESKKKKCSLKIALKDNLEEVFEQVETGGSDIGLVTFNANELIESFAEYQTELQMDLLARDEMVGVLNKRFMKQEELSISKDDFRHRRMSLYNIIPSNMYKVNAQTDSMVWSNDSEFHRAMLERNGTIVMMPGLAHQFFFSNKKYVAVSVENLEIPLLHAAVYRKDAPTYIQEFVNLIRLEMHMK